MEIVIGGKPEMLGEKVCQSYVNLKVECPTVPREIIRTELQLNEHMIPEYTRNSDETRHLSLHFVQRKSSYKETL